MIRTKGLLLSILILSGLCCFILATALPVSAGGGPGPPPDQTFLRPLVVGVATLTPTDQGVGTKASFEGTCQDEYLSCDKTLKLTINLPIEFADISVAGPGDLNQWIGTDVTPPDQFFPRIAIYSLSNLRTEKNKLLVDVELAFYDAPLPSPTSP